MTVIGGVPEPVELRRIVLHMGNEVKLYKINGALYVWIFCL